MCFRLHSQNIRVSKKKRGFNSTRVGKRVATKILKPNFISSESANSKKDSDARVRLTFMSTPLINILSELNLSEWILPYFSIVWLLLRYLNRVA